MTVAEAPEESVSQLRFLLAQAEHENQKLGCEFREALQRKNVSVASSTAVASNRGYPTQADLARMKRESEVKQGEELKTVHQVMTGHPCR